MQEDIENNEESSKNMTLFIDHTDAADGSELRRIELKDRVYRTNSTKSHLQQLEDLTYEYHRSLNKIEVIYIQIMKNINVFA